MLLGSTSPTLSASQAQMYLRAQMVSFDYSPCKVWLWSVPVGRSKISFLNIVDIGLLFYWIFFSLICIIKGKVLLSAYESS